MSNKGKQEKQARPYGRKNDLNSATQTGASSSITPDEDDQEIYPEVIKPTRDPVQPDPDHKSKF